MAKNDDQEAARGRNEQAPVDSLTAATSEQRATHTPGPWIAEPVPSDAYTDPDIHADEDEAFWVSESRVAGHVIAAVHRYPVEQAETNARLIAAAPELLAALKGLGLTSVFHDGVCFMNCYVNDDGRHDAECAAARAAIAKAEGRS